MEKESSSRRHRHVESHRDRESSRSHRNHSKHDDDRRRSDDQHHRRREGSEDRDLRRERERSRSVERKKRKERGDSEERSHSGERSKRRDRGESEERSHPVERSKRKERGESEERSHSVERNKRKDTKESEERSEKRARIFEENGKERRRFEDAKRRDETGSTANGIAVEPITTLSRTSAETFVVHSLSPTKVSSISKTNENKGVNSNRSHEVPGKYSTDGTATDTGKRGGLSLDVLAKARRALQKQKELAEKMKKIPSLNRDADSTGEGSTEVGKKEAANVPSSTKGILPKSVSQGIPATGTPSTSAATTNAVPQSGLPHLPGLTAQKFEAVKRAQELAVKMGFRQDPEFAPLLNMFPGQQVDVSIQPKPSKAPVLRLDALGREIDEHGNVVNVPKANSLSTLKVNINKQKKDAFQILKPELDVDPDKNPFYDARMGIDKNKILRPKRMSFQFVEEGKWSKDAEIIKLKSQFGEAKAKELKVKQAQMEKAKAEPDINPNLIEVGERFVTKEKPKEEAIPDVEWWDVPFLQSGTYDDIANGGDISEDKLKMEKFTIYVEHPLPIEPPAEPAPPPPQPLKLTKKEQKKLRTQRRLAKEKDRQEMIRLGVLEPPKAKVKMSNLMKVLGSEATQDPTKLEMEIRSAAAEREQAHIDRNIARKLTPAERREKKVRKLFDDLSTVDTIVSVYKINDLSHPQARFKVDINAHENKLSGCAVISEGISVVVVEGGAKSIKRYGKLMLKRIDWTASVKKGDNDESDDDDEKPANKCVLVWQGSVGKPNFSRFFMQECRTEAAARKYFLDHGVGHYWDLAVNFTDDVM